MHQTTELQRRPVVFATAAQALADPEPVSYTHLDVYKRQGYLADQHNVSARTLWNWYAQYRKLGYAGLVDRVRSDKGKSRFLKAHPAVRAYLENKYLGERLSIRLVYQACLLYTSRCV